MPCSAPLSKPQLWRERFAQFHSSQLTVAQFCRSVDCSVAAFYQWKRKLAIAQPTTKPSSAVRPMPAFLRVESLSPPDTAIEVKLSTGVSIFVPLSAIDSLRAILAQLTPLTPR